jgi:serine/threonine protein kinase
MHRDLKLENILFESRSADSPIRVIDFGESKLLKEKEMINERTGSVMLHVAVSYFIWLQRYYRRRSIISNAICGV